MIDRQTIFTRAVNGIRKQGGPASTDDRACCYRTDNGRACAIGHNIDDANYSSDLEGLFGSNTPVVLAMDLNPETTTFEEDQFLDQLQKRLHDTIVMDRIDRRSPTADADFMEVFEREIIDFAKVYELEVPQ